MQKYKSSAEIILAYKKLSKNTMLIMFIEDHFALAMPFNNLKQILALFFSLTGGSLT